MTETTTEAPARNYVGGEWRQSVSGETYEKRNPWRPSLVTGVFVASGSEDARLGVEAAHDAAPAWASLAAAQRGAFLHRAADAIEARAERIARDMTAEMGKPLRESRLEAARAATILRYAAGEAWRPVGELYEPSVPDQRLYTLRRPVGVVGLITPWNFPIAIPVWKLAPALAYGNVVVLKLARGAADGHPRRRVLRRSRPAARRAQRAHGSRLDSRRRAVRNPLVRAISFTGSVPVGHAVRGRRRPAAAVFSSSSRPQPARRGG